jgi:hypothetical protein
MFLHYFLLSKKRCELPLNSKICVELLLALCEKFTSRQLLSNNEIFFYKSILVLIYKQQSSPVRELHQE